MKITQKFELTKEEKEHLHFTMRFFREIDNDPNVKDRLETDFCAAIADRLNWFLDEFEGEEAYTIEPNINEWE